MDYLKDFIYLSKSSMKKTRNSIKKHWPLIFTGFFYSIINMFLYRVFSLILRGPLYIFSGIIYALFSSAILSHYLYLLLNI